MAWSADLDFEATYNEIRKAITSKAVEYQWYKRKDRLIKTQILLIALRNGLRNSEAIEAYNEFLDTNNKTVTVRVRKRGFTYTEDENGKRKRLTNTDYPDMPVFRQAIIPDEITAIVSKRKISTNALTKFCRRGFEFNPHALRYSFITHLSKKGIVPQLIARITEHATIQHILKYTETQAAVGILANEVL